MRKPQITEIDRIAVEARAAGMSYGQYVAWAEYPVFVGAAAPTRPRKTLKQEKPKKPVKRKYRRLVAFDEAGNVLGEYRQAKEAAEAYGVLVQTIYEDCWGFHPEPFSKGRKVRFEYVEKELAN